MKIPAVFHNLRGYDSLIILLEIGKVADDTDINVIANNMEKYSAFMFGQHLVFIDSFQFTSSSFGKVADDTNINVIPNNMDKY